MKEIPLFKNGNIVGKALVDDEDFEFLNDFTWRKHSAGYAVRYERGPQHTHYMHRIILNAPKGLEVDHANGCRFDNQKSNIRLCTRLENRRNNGQKVGVSGRRGDKFRRTQNNDWAVQRHRICVCGLRGKG